MALRGSLPIFELDLSEAHLAWKTMDFDYVSCVHNAIEKSLSIAKIPEEIKEKPLEVCVVLANDEMIATLNLEYKNKRGPTNVLSFAAIDSDMPVIDDENTPYALGDIILALETIERESKEQNKSFPDHVTHLITHGTLHLLGYDHEEDTEAEIMENLEIEILNELGIKNPYKYD